MNHLKKMSADLQVECHEPGGVDVKGVDRSKVTDWFTSHGFIPSVVRVGRWVDTNGIQLIWDQEMNFVYKPGL